MSDPSRPVKLCVAARSAAFTSVSMLALGFGMSAAFAQTVTPAATANNVTIREITVTAEHRTSTVQKTAASISVRTGADMIKQGRRTLADFLEDVPGVSGAPDNAPAAEATPNAFNPYVNIVIRGVVPGGASIPSTAVYTDSVYQGLGGDYDLSRVEVLRGPQGTLYGRSATGGVVAIYTADPVIGKFAANLTGTYGNYDLRDVQAAVNLPIGNQLALRISGREFDELGYINFRDGSHSEGESRVKLLYQPSADLSVLLGVATQEDHSHTGGPNFAEKTPGVLTVAGFTPVEPAEDHGHQFWANANWNLGWANATYIPTFRRTYYEPSIAYAGPPGSPVGINPSENPLDQTFTQEARLASNPGSKLSWIGGVFYYNYVYKNDIYLRWINSGAIAFDNSQRKLTQDTGVFGEATYPLLDTLRLNAGLRYDYTEVQHSEVGENNETHCQYCAPGTPQAPFNPMFGLPEDLSYLTLSPTQGESTFNDITYKVRLEYDLAPTNMVYALASSGYLPGDVQVSSHNNGSLFADQYNQETLNAFEIGSKNRFLDNRLQLNGSVYYYLYSGYQQNAQPQPNIPGTANIIIEAPARMYGLDFEAIYLITPVDRFNVNLGAIKAEFTGNPLTTDTVDDESGYFRTFVYQKNITGISPFTLSPAYEHTFLLPDGSSILGRADMTLTAGYDETPLNLLGLVTGLTAAQSLPYTHVGTQILGNLAVTWTSADSKYSVGGFVRNLGNDIYPTGLYIDTGVAAGVPSIGRTYGVTMHLSY